MESVTFNTPISFHIFNRPDSTKKVFEQIRKIKPRKLFVTADGPRESTINDIENCKITRSIIDNVDWDCEVKKKFLDINMGSFRAPAEGIGWVFNHVDQAIILEDDCVPHQSFFLFCQQLLDLYKDDERIALITGNNYLQGHFKTKYSYYFSRYTNMWGWATWKRTWKQMENSLSCWVEFRDMEGLKTIFRKKHEVAYWYEIMEKIHNGTMEPHWDYLLMLSMYMNNALAIKPCINLINNIGFGDNSTHFVRKHSFQGIKTEKVSWPLIHPPFICNSINADEYAHSLLSGGRLQYEKNRIKKLLPNVILDCFSKSKAMIKN